MSDLELLQLKMKQVEVAKALSNYGAAQPQAAVNQGSAVGRVGSAVMQGLTAPFQQPMPPLSPATEQFIQNSPDALKGINRTVSETFNTLPEVGKRVLQAGVGAMTGAAGQISAELQGPQAAAQRGMTLPQLGQAQSQGLQQLAPVAAGPETGASIQTPMRIKQMIGPSKNLEPGAAEAARVLADRGATLPAAKATTSTGLDMLANTAETSVLSGKLRNANAKAANAAQAAADNFAADMSANMSKEHIGEVLKSAVQDKVDAFNAAARGAYKAVDDAMTQDGAGGPMVDLRPLKQQAAAIQAEVQAGADPTGTQLVNTLLDKKDFVSFGDAQILRSDLLNLTYNPQELIGGRTKAFGKRLAPLVDQQMEAAASTAGPQALSAWRDANALWAQGKTVFNARVMKAIAKNDADTVYQSVVKNNKPQNIRRVRDLVGPDVWKNVQSQLVQDMYSKALDGTDLSGDKLMAQIKQFEVGGTYKEILNDPVIADRWKTLARTLQLTQKGNATSTMKIRGTISSGFVPELYAGYQLAMGGGTVMNGAILITPTVLNRIMASPRLSRWLIQGVGNPGGSVVGTNATRHLISALVANGLVDKTQNPTENLNKLNADQAASNMQHNANTMTQMPVNQ